MSRRQFVAALGTLLSLAVALSGGQTPEPPTPAPFTVVSASGRQMLAVAVVSGHEMVTLDEVSALFHLTVREDSLAGGVTVAAGGRTVVFTPNQTVVSVAGRLISLPAPPVRDGRRWLVPVEFVSRALAPLLGEPIDLRPASRVIVVGHLRVPQVDVSIDASAAQARVIFTITPPTAHAVVADGERLLVRFEADLLDVRMPASFPQGLVRAVRIVNPVNLMAVTLDPRFGSYRTTTEPAEGSERLVIDVTAPASGPPPLGGIAPQVAQPAVPAPPAAGGASGLIVLDPGHGGEDTGTSGPGGTLEKDVTLAIAQRLKQTLEERLGVRVLLTRSGDQAVPVDERTAFANNNRASCFVSLHANAAPHANVRGAQIYTLAVEAAEVAGTSAAVAVPSLGGGMRLIDVVPWDRAQLRHLPQSVTLAEFMHQELAMRVPMAGVPLVQAPLRVLVGANMPAVLVETGYLSNPDEEQQLRSDTYQRPIAEGLAAALVRFQAYLQHAVPAGENPAPPAGPQGGRFR